MSIAAPTIATDDAEKAPPTPSLFASPAIVFCLAALGLFAATAIVGPFLVGDHLSIDTSQRLRAPSAAHWFGTDHLGRDIFARTVVGTRSSLIVGGAVALVTTIFGVLIGLYAGYFRWGERIVMRLMDGLMAIPGVLLAIALASLLGGGLTTVIIAIMVPDLPRMVRLVRSVVLTLKEQPYVTAAISIGTPVPKILALHILPNAVGALSVQATYICASAIITEAVLSFLGVGAPPDVPSWGNIMAVGRQYFQIAPWIIGFPGILLSILVLAINILGDALRDRLDPRLARRSGLR
jgi:peptide/nickel transport system permease protein